MKTETVTVFRGKDKAMYFPLTEKMTTALNLHVGHRIVWTVGQKGEVSFRKRSARYKLKPSEYNSYVVDIPTPVKKKRN
jgi:hypothetical protein